MISGFGWAALALLFGYLALFFWGSALAAPAAGRPVWLFARATGRDRLAAMGFRMAFALAFFGPFLWLAVRTAEAQLARAIEAHRASASLHHQDQGARIDRRGCSERDRAAGGRKVQGKKRRAK